MMRLIAILRQSSQMNRLLILPVLLLTLLAGTPVSSADFQKGKDAYDSGDFPTAVRALAEQGDASAQFELGFLYKNGRHGVPQNSKTAVKWCKLAAEQGYAPAQYQLGAMHEVAQDYKTAVKWYRLTAEQGVARAQFQLGLMYDRGNGVIKDNVFAHMWFNIAASNGNEFGGKLRDSLAERMTSSQLEKAQDLARECVRKKYKGC